MRQVAVVTGGTRGIGLAIAHRLGRRRFDLWSPIAATRAAANGAASELAATGRRIEVFAADVATADGPGR